MKGDSVIQTITLDQLRTAEKGAKLAAVLGLATDYVDGDAPTVIEYSLYLLGTPFGAIVKLEDETLCSKFKDSLPESPGSTFRVTTDCGYVLEDSDGFSACECVAETVRDATPLMDVPSVHAQRLGEQLHGDPEWFDFCVLN